MTTAISAAFKFGCALLGMAALSAPTIANSWVYGRVQSVEDYGSYCCASNGAKYEVLVDLKDKAFEIPAEAATCNQRFRIAVGPQGVTEENQKRFFAMLLAAYTTQAKVRLYYSTDGAPFCYVMIASIGDF
jgi:hypothetical protein